MKSEAGHKHLFYLEMAKLLQAGFGIREAAAVLLDTKLPPPQAKLLKDLHSGLEAGNTITGAFAKDTAAVSELERSMIGAGERGGNLAPAFQHLADYFGMIAAARREMITSMVYPLVVMHLGIFIAVVPTAMMRGDSFVTILGQLVVALVVFYSVCLVAFFLVRGFLKTASASAAADGFLHRIPLVGKTRQNMAMARFCNVYHSCLLAGIPMVETVRLATSASHAGLISIAGKKVESAARGGGSLGPAFVAEGAFPKAFARSYTTGEEAGTLDTDLARWAKLFQSEAEAGAKNLAAVVPRILYFFILAFVAWKIISFFNGYYSGMLEQLE